MTASPIDTRYDQQFAARKSLPWWPWVGCAFAESPVRTMIVGESIYMWSPEARERYSRADGLRVTHTNHAMALRHDSRYVRNIERALFACRKPSDRQKYGFWTNVAYHNLVLVPLSSRRRRPTQAEYQAGWRELFALCQLMEVKQCLVYGLEHSKLKALESAAEQSGHACVLRDAGTLGARRATLQMGNAQLELLFIRHPSAFFSWRQWAPLVRDNLALEFLPPGPEPSVG